MSNQNEYTVRILNESDITPELDSAIKELLVVCFPHRTDDFSRCRWLNNNTPDFTTVVEHDGKVVANIATIERMITVGAAAIRVAGVGNVGVGPQHRGKGLCNMAIKTAMAEANRRGYDTGLLFCQKHVIDIYARNGWSEIPDMPITYLENNKPVQFTADRLKMFFPLNLSEFPQGPANLNGPRW